MNAPVTPIPPYHHTPLFPLGPDETPTASSTSGGVEVEKVMGRDMLVVAREAIRALAEAAFIDINHLLRPAHLKQLRAILDDPEASANDKFVAYDLLKNANIAAGGVLPMCQDTGTAIIMGKKGRYVFTDGQEDSDEAALARRRARCVPEKEPALFAARAALDVRGEEHRVEHAGAGRDLCGGRGRLQVPVHRQGRRLGQQVVPVSGDALDPHARPHDRVPEGEDADARHRGVPALSPRDRDRRHLGRATMKTVKLASPHYYDTLPTQGSEDGHAFRDLEMEAEVLKLTQSLGVGAQFGGKYFCHDVRVIRLPRHGASLPIGLGVSCSADRQALGKITRDGVFLEQLEQHPAQYLPEVDQEKLGGAVVKVDLNRPMKEILAQLSKYPVKTRLSLSGPMIVARDLAHAKLRERLEAGQGLPDYFKNHPVYYAGPAKTPEGYASGSFGPTTAGRMDSFVDAFQAAGGSMILLAKGNRSAQVREACKKHGGFYLASIGGSAANLAEHCIKKVECQEYPELGMEAIWRIEVEDFPAFIVIDDKGNDFFKELNLG